MFDWLDGLARLAGGLLLLDKLWVDGEVLAVDGGVGGGCLACFSCTELVSLYVCMVEVLFSCRYVVFDVLGDVLRY